MRNPFLKYMFWGGLAAVILCGPVMAQEGSIVSLTMVPIKTAFVKGDVAKFRAMTWTKDSSQSGLGDSSLETKFGKDVHVSFEGSGMFGDTDYDGSMLIQKDNVGYIKTDYKGFRQYFDNHGGYFPYQHLSVNTLDQDLALDLGHFAFEVGRGTPEDSSFGILFERDTKNGNEDRLSWATVKDTMYNGATPNVYKQTSPSWANMDETTDKITLRGKTKALGFNVKGAQTYSFFESNSTRYEYWLVSPTATSVDSKVRGQNIAAQAKELTTTIFADRWSLNDKTYVSLGYHFSHLRNTEDQVIKEYTNLGTWTGAYSSAKNKSGWALNTDDKNTWTAQMLSNITPSLAFNSRFKAEVSQVNGSSDYMSYSTATPPVPSSMASARNEEREHVTAEGFGLKYNGLPKTSLYADLDTTQSYKKQAFSTYYFDNVAPALEWKTGARFFPVKGVTITTEYKHDRNNDKAQSLTTPTATVPFLSRLLTDKDEVSAKISWKPVKWMEHGFTVKGAENKVRTVVYSQNMQKAQETERDFNYDITLMPLDALMFNISYGLQQFNTDGPASTVTAAQLPVYTANVYSWAFSTSYAPTAKLSLFNTLGYSRAKNPDNNYNVTSTGPVMLYGSDTEWYDADFGVKWSLRKNLTVAPHYAYYGYRSFESIETGNYSAHVIWLDVNMKW